MLGKDFGIEVLAHETRKRLRLCVHHPRIAIFSKLAVLWLIRDRVGAFEKADHAQGKATQQDRDQDEGSRPADSRLMVRRTIESDAYGRAKNI